MTDQIADDPILRAQGNWQAAGWDAGPHFLASLSIAAVADQIRAADAPILEPYGLTHTRHEMLAVLYFSRRGEMPISALSRALLLHLTSVTSTLEALVGLGYVERVPHPDDRRTTLARITAEGRKVMRKTSIALVDARHGTGALSDEEALLLFRLLAKVRSASPATAGR
jgi:DNA-binding MarR family transcriptional regulator